jgi:hypothetical protein
MCLLYVEIKGMSTKGGSILAGKLRLVFKTDKRHKVIDTAINGTLYMLYTLNTYNSVFFINS